jgi:hypothetical protein
MDSGSSCKIEPESMLHKARIMIQVVVIMNEIILIDP